MVLMNIYPWQAHYSHLYTVVYLIIRSTLQVGAYIILILELRVKKFD